MNEPKIPEPKQNKGNTIEKFIKNRAILDKISIFFSIPVAGFTVSCAVIAVVSTLLKMDFGLQPHTTIFNHSYIIFAVSSAVLLHNGLTEKHNLKLVCWFLLKALELILLGLVILYSVLNLAYLKLIILSFTLMITTGIHMYSIYKYAEEAIEPVNS